MFQRWWQTTETGFAGVTSDSERERELEPTRRFELGRGNRDIAQRLFLSPRTVETHVKHLVHELGVGSRAEIAAWYAREIASKPSA